MKRRSGILLHISSLPGSFGIGSMGEEAFKFVDFLKKSKQSLWQLLPLGHTGYGNSPYSSYSAFAGNPLLIDLHKLVKQKFLEEHELQTQEQFESRRVDFEKVKDFKIPLIRKAAARFIRNEMHLSEKFLDFKKDNEFWLPDYTLFIALKEHFNNVSVYDFEEKIRKGDGRVMKKWRNTLGDKILELEVIQYFFLNQWLELKEYANENDIKIIGDIPLYVAEDSADVWSKPKNFELDKNLKPKNVAGVPPDYFSETGQLWGNPVYNWKHLKKENFAWWIERLRQNFKLYDIVRIDHFRALDAYWAVPAGEKTAMNGKWVKAPGNELLKAVFEKLDDAELIAEDLGVITPDVEKLRDDFNLPGMRVLQFGFELEDDSSFLPHNYISNTVVYTGTHDNNTSLGWYRTLEEEPKNYFKAYTCVDENNPNHSLMRLAWGSVAKYALAPMQDVISFGEDAVMNKPGTAEGNWEWRYTREDIKEWHPGFLAAWSKVYDRNIKKEPKELSEEQLAAMNLE